MIQEPFAAGDSCIHHFDPRIRVVFAVFFSVVIAISKAFPALSAALAAALLLVGLAQLRILVVVRRLLWVNLFILFLWVVLPFSYEGRSLFSIGPLIATWPGVVVAAQITLKSNAIILIIIALVATMTTVTLGHALNALWLPDKLVHLLLMTYRYLFVLEQELQRLVRAAKIRGFKPDTSIHTYRTYAYLVGMLFVKASERARRVHQAMQCRGFNGRFYCLRDFRVTGSDRALTIFLTAILIAVIALNFGSQGT